VKKRIHVNQAHIRSNAACNYSGELKPPISIQTSRGVIPAFEVEIPGPSKLTYNGKQLHCGARLWIEVNGPVIADGQVIA
jgi:hypothetical protein